MANDADTTTPRPPPKIQPIRKPERAKPGPKPKAVDEKTSAPKPRGRPRTLRDRIREFIASIAMAVSLFDAQDGMIVMESVDELADAWANLASQNARVRENIERVLSGGAWSAIVMTHGSIAFRIAQRHGVFESLPLPGSGLGGDNGTPSTPEPPQDTPMR